MTSRVFAIDFTHEEMTAAFVSRDGHEEDSAGFDLKDFLAGETEPLDKLLSLLAAKARAGGDGIQSIVLSLPCDISPARDRVLSFPSAHWLNGQPLPELLQAATGLPVMMERRAIISLCYDYAMLGLPATGLAVGCYVDTHYDSAIWYDGKPIRGRNGRAGNIAHMAIQEREDNCFCGKQGCVDLYGAGVRVRQMHTMIFPDLPLEELFERHAEHPIIQDYIAMMAYPIAIETNVLDPDFLILGGSVSAMRGFPRALLEKEILRQSYLPEEGCNPVFLASVASSSPGVVCAAQYAFMDFCGA